MTAIAPLNIPPAILAINDVTASEKMLLALYAAEPDAKNFRAMRVVGVGLAGLKKIKGRLQAKGLLRLTASGYQILVPGLTSETDAAGGYFVPNSSGIENENEVAPPPARLRKEPSLLETWDSHVAVYEQALRAGTFPATLGMLSQKFLDFVTNELAPDCPGRDQALAQLTVRRDYWFAASYAADTLPQRSLPKVAKLIGDATPQQLAALRTGIQQAQLAGGKPVLLLEQLAGTHRQ